MGYKLHSADWAPVCLRSGVQQGKGEEMFKLEGETVEVAEMEEVRMRNREINMSHILPDQHPHMISCYVRHTRQGCFDGCNGPTRDCRLQHATRQVSLLDTDGLAPIYHWVDTEWPKGAKKVELSYLWLTNLPASTLTAPVFTRTTCATIILFELA